MACAVCGKQAGFLAKLSAHSGDEVCKECKKQAMSRLQTLTHSICATPVWKQQYVQGWLAQYDEAIRKYRLSEAEAAPIRNALLSEIVRLAEAKEAFSETDLRFVGSVLYRYCQSEPIPSEIQETIQRIVLRQAIQTLESGGAQQRQCTSLVLQNGEICHWEDTAGLLIQKTKREYIGGSGGVSVPVGHGVRVRVGAFKAVPIDKTIYESGGAGTLHVTNQRICFTGSQKSMAIPYKKIINVAGFLDGFEVHLSSGKQPGMFQVRTPELTVELVNLAAARQGEGTADTGRRRKLPQPA